MEHSSIDGALAAMKAEREWDRANPENPVCPGCNRRYPPEDLKEVACFECLDVALFLRTGCFFGKSPCCGNEDCKLPLLDEERDSILLLMKQGKI